MEIGSARPVLTGVTVPAQKAPAAIEQSVKTDLEAAAVVTEGKAVAPATGSEQKTRIEAESSNRDAANARRDRLRTIDRETRGEIERDPRTEDLIYRRIDVQSGDVVRQVPEESILRMRAMIESWGEAAPRAGQQRQYDTTA